MEKREVIMDHYSNPRNRRRINDVRYIQENTRNSSCIDNLDIYIDIENGYIEDITFDGEACAISISSASIILALYFCANILLIVLFPEPELPVIPIIILYNTFLYNISILFV